jgi:hypothetical protein
MKAQSISAFGTKSFKHQSEQKTCLGIVTVSITVFSQEVFMGRGILLWLLGIPIPIIILIMLFAR